MVSPYDDGLEDLLWWDLMSDEPNLEQGLEELTNDPEAGVVAAVGIFTILKLRFWHRLPESISDELEASEHQTDDCSPPHESPYVSN